jgi:hypothetical protein
MDTRALRALGMLQSSVVTSDHWTNKEIRELLWSSAIHPFCVMHHVVAGVLDTFAMGAQPAAPF